MAIDGVMVRTVVPADLNYIYSTWLRDLRDSDPSPLPDELWFPAHRAHAEALLSDPRTIALVAAASDDPREILAYIVADEDAIWWLNVRKGPLRGKGLAKLLMDETKTHNTPLAWATRDSRVRLTNPCRSRQIRRDQRARARSTIKK